MKVKLKGNSNKSYIIIALCIIIGGLIFILMNTSKKDIYYEMADNSYSSSPSSLNNSIINMDDDDDKIINIKDFRTFKDKITAIEKFINGNGKIIMFHYTSCCKTVLNEWFHRIELKLKNLHKDKDKDGFEWKSVIQHIDIKNNFHEQFGMNIGEFMNKNRDTIFIICFNEPIKRILSQYDKEWRWRCKECIGNKHIFMEQYDKKKINMNNYLSYINNTKNMNNLEEERFAVIDFNDFLYRIVKFEIEQISINNDLYQMFLNNYYLWSFCCNKQKCVISRDIEYNINLMQKCMDYTMNLLKSFDFIFIKDWIQDLRVQHYVNEIFFKNNNIDDQRNKFVSVGKKQYKVSSLGNNYMFNPENEKILNILNKYDLKLFEWIMDLVFNRTHFVWETSKINKNNRNELIYDLGFKNIIMSHP